MQFECAIFTHSGIDNLYISSVTALRGMPIYLTDDKSTLVHEMAWWFNISKNSLLYTDIYHH